MRDFVRIMGAIACVVASIPCGIAFAMSFFSPPLSQMTIGIVVEHIVIGGIAFGVMCGLIAGTISLARST